MHKTMADIEMTGGRVFEGVRIILADKIALERECKAHGWETDGMRANGVLAWAALRRLGEDAAPDPVTFQTDQLVDAFIWADNTPAGEAAEDPTSPGH